MNPMRRLLLIVTLFIFFLPTYLGADIRIVTWNVSPSLSEGLEDRLDEIRQMSNDLNPDVVILQEIAGEVEAQRIADALGWSEYYGAVSNWGKAVVNVYFALEVAVISRVPIVSMTELDTKIDGFHEVFTHDGIIHDRVTEAELSSSGINGFGDTLAHTDRGTLEVRLEGGITIFPVHLKSNRNGVCADLLSATRTLKKYGIDVPVTLKTQYGNGSARTTKAHVDNAKKRERVIAAVKLHADEAHASGSTVIIAGDMNTALEPGKAGVERSDCTLKSFSCDKAPFPANACADGDGFDDTLGILQHGLVGKTKWDLLTKDLGRTYDDIAFADRAIDHIAVPADQAVRFTNAQKHSKSYGSDHFPVWVDLKSN